MTKGEQQMLVRGVGVGTIQGIALGLVMAPFLVVKPESFAWLFQ